MKKSRVFIIVAISIILLIAIYPYFQAEILTMKYGDQFTNEYAQTGMIDKIDYFRVIKYNDNFAEVFYVTDSHSSGELVKFQIIEGRWTKVYWNAIWSKTGNADEFKWPYYI